MIRDNQPKGPLCRCGYNLAGILTADSLDLAGLMVGSEGTLGLITEATLATQAAASLSRRGLADVRGPGEGLRAGAEILPTGPSACELMDRRHLSLARENESRFELLIPAETEALLLVEYEGDDPLDVRDRVHRVADELCQQKRLAFGARQAFDQDDIDLFWRLANKTQPLLYQVKGPSRPVPVVEDVAVPPEMLPAFLVRMQNVLKRQQITASLLCHLGQGQLHIQPFLDLDDAGDVERMRQMADELYQEVFDAGGTISGEHAYGLSRTAFLARQVGPLYDVLREVKQIFDPDNILNPGKIVGEDAELLTRHLRPAMTTGPWAPPQEAAADSPQLRDLVELQLNWDPSRVHDVTAACNRCGECRSQSPAGADVSHLPLRPGRRGLAPRQGQPDSWHLERQRGVGRPDQRRIQRGRRFVRPLPCLPAGVPGRRRYPAADAREQGGLRGGQRPAAFRLAHDSARSALCPGQPGEPAGQLGTGQSADALADGEDAGHRPGAEAAASVVAEFSPPGRPAAADAAGPPQPARKSSTLSTPTPIITIRNWARPWSR